MAVFFTRLQEQLQTLPLKYSKMIPDTHNRSFANSSESIGKSSEPRLSIYFDSGHVPRKHRIEIVRHVAAAGLRTVKVGPQFIVERRMGALCDDRACTLSWGGPAEVGNALIG